jgi:methyl-accepting chemotaxis protein
MLKNLTIKSRLIFVVSFLSVWLFAGGVIGLTSLSASNSAMRINYENRLVPMGMLDQIVRLQDRNQLAIAQALTDDAAGIAREMDASEKRIAEIGKLWDSYVASGLGANEKALADKTATDNARFLADGLKPAMAALRAQDAAKATTLMRGPMTQLFQPVHDNINALMQMQLDTAKKEFENNEFMFLLVKISCTSGILFGIVTGAAICVWLLRAISKPLDEAVSVAKSVAAGDLTRKIEVKSQDEVGQLMLALKEMNDSLVKIVAQVRNGTETISTATREIASGNLDLSSRTEEQASSLEETASSMEELTSTVKQNADSAQQANNLAVSASTVATKGGAVVTQVVDTMSAINASAKKIEDIIGVIDGIAFQTNILALNAAVEAARAGEQGRGFAVVASEVRHLAQRSAAAAKEIKNLIGDSVEKVNTGTKLVDEAGATMAEIVESVQRVTRIMSEITIASREQTDGIEQVNQAIAQMDESTQQNAALVEQAAAAAESLQDQTSNLAQVVSVFRLDESQVQRPASPVVRLKAAASAPKKSTPKHVTGADAGNVRKLASAHVAGDSDWEEF